MASILRQTGALSRFSRSSFRSAARSSIRPSNHNPLAVYRISAQQQFRGYAKDNGPKDPKKTNGKQDDGKLTGTAKKQDLPSKPAPGTENLYSGKTPLSKKKDDAPQTDDVPPREGTRRYVELPPVDEDSKLSPQEQQLFTLMFDDVRAKLILPKQQLELFDKAVERIKKEGVPDEVRRFVVETKGPMTTWKAVKLASLVTSWSEANPTEGKAGTEDRKPGAEEQEKQQGRAGGGDGSGKGPKGQKDEGPIPNMKVTIFGRRIDFGTVFMSVVAMLIISAIPVGTPMKEITFQEFRNTFFDKGLVEKLTVDNGGHRVQVDLHREATRSLYPDSPAANGNVRYFFTIGSVESFERRIDEAQKELGIPTSERVPITYASPNDTWALFMYLLPTLLFIAPIIYIARRGSGGGMQNNVFGMGKSRAKKFNHETDVKVKFKDVAGMDEAKTEIMEFVSFLKKPEQFQKLGAKIPRGAILSGPPGTGKTLLAKATAGESEVPFFSVSGSEFVEMFVGVGASRVRDLFAMARKSTPCIIFIDEIDAIGKARSKGGSFGGNDEREATLNQILTEMDGFNTSEQVVVLAGTNRADVLDKALLRPGRFDRHIAIDRPTMDGRKQIFLVHLRKIVTHEDMDYLAGRLAALTPGFAGADIANCCNEAALIAARHTASSVAMTHFEQAIERVIGGLEKKSLVLSPEEKKTVAYHEAGHAICGWYLKYADPLLKVSIIPRGQGALGYAQYLPAGDTYLMNVNQLMDRMAMTLGGRISEELHFDTVTSGASDDFNKVTRMATAMVTKWGMSKKLGPLHFEDDENKFHKPFAESTAQTIDSEVRRIVDEAYKQCRDLLTEKKKEVGLVAEELLSKEVLGRDDMVRLLGPRPFDENKDFTKYFGGGGTSAPPPFPGESTDSPPEQPPPM